MLDTDSPSMGAMNSLPLLLLRRERPRSFSLTAGLKTPTPCFLPSRHMPWKVDPSAYSLTPTPSRLPSYVHDHNQVR